MTAFNDLEEVTRRRVADYVLTSCNVFSGRAAFFSERYESESATME